MRYVYLTLAGLLGGVLAGLGFGGGTLTIPLLVLALGVGQLVAQAVNLFAFLPSGSVALFLHAKNGYVDFKIVPIIVLPAVVACVFASYFAQNADGEILKKAYGCFLIAVAICSLVAKIIQFRKIGYLH